MIRLGLTFFSVALLPTFAFSNILDQFEVLSSKGESSQIILIGNRHSVGGKETDASRTANRQDRALLSSLGSDGDILLLEGVEAGEVAPEQITIDGKKFKTFGWDNKIAHQFSEQLMGDASDSLGQNNSYGYVQLLQWGDITVRQRNRFLVEAALAYARQYPNKKVFVTAGSEHVFQPDLIERFKQESYPFVIYAAKGTRDAYEKSLEVESGARRELAKSIAEPQLTERLNHSIAIARKVLADEVSKRYPSGCIARLVEMALRK